MAENQEQFARLISQGVSNAQACRMVGVDLLHGDTLEVRAHGLQRGR